MARDFPISLSEYNRLSGLLENAKTQAGDVNQPWGAYNPLTNSCVDFSWNIMREAVISGSFFDVVLYPKWNNPFVDSAYLMAMK